MRALAVMTGDLGRGVADRLATGAYAEAATAAVLFAIAAAVFGIGECLQGPTQGALVADLAPERLRGRYMAISTTSWQVGFVIGPARRRARAQRRAARPLAARRRGLPRRRGGRAAARALAAAASCA